MCIRIYIFNFKKEKQDKKEAKDTKEEKRIPVENLTGYDDIVFEFALCTFNLLDRERDELINHSKYRIRSARKQPSVIYNKSYS